MLDRVAADYLADPKKAVFIYPFVGRERSAAEVSKAFGVNLNTLCYRIGRLIALGLLQVTRQRSRHGRAVKLYRATADAFFVPLRATGLEGLEAMVDQWSQSLQPIYLRSFADALRAKGRDWGVRISREADGRLMIAPASRPDELFNYFMPDAPAIIEGWFSDFWLDAGEAKALQFDLLQVYLKYASAKPGAADKKRYLLRVGLAPLSNAAVLPPAW